MCASFGKRCVPERSRRPWDVRQRWVRLRASVVIENGLTRLGSRGQEKEKGNDTDADNQGANYLGEGQKARLHERGICVGEHRAQAQDPWMSRSDSLPKASSRVEALALRSALCVLADMAGLLHALVGTSSRASSEPYMPGTTARAVLEQQGAVPARFAPSTRRASSQRLGAFTFRHLVLREPVNLDDFGTPRWCPQAKYLRVQSWDGRRDVRAQLKDASGRDDLATWRWFIGIGTLKHSWQATVSVKRSGSLPLASRMAQQTWSSWMGARQGSPCRSTTWLAISRVAVPARAVS